MKKTAPSKAVRTDCDRENGDDRRERRPAKKGGGRTGAVSNRSCAKKGDAAPNGWSGPHPRCTRRVVGPFGGEKARQGGGKVLVSRWGGTSRLLVLLDPWLQEVGAVPVKSDEKTDRG